MFKIVILAGIVCFAAGAIMGVLIVALMIASGRDEDEDEIERTTEGGADALEADGSDAGSGEGAHQV
jgi:hypothetical protein